MIWKLFGERLDGWSNADHPTESVPGDPSTLPAGANPNDADLDYTGTIMPPPGSGVPPLTNDEKFLFARWIDLGCPIDTGQGANAAYGWLLDDLRPTVTVSQPRPGYTAEAIDTLRFGLADANSGLDLASLSVTADFPVAGRPPGAELADLAVEEADGVYTIHAGGALPSMTSANLLVSVRDVQGNVTPVDRRFATTLPASFADGFESGDTSAWSVAVP